MDKTETKILIVDDEAIIAEHLYMMLQAKGYTSISMAHDKLKALQTIDSFKPDLVLLDIRMKGQGDGLEVAEYINRHSKIPFIYITAHSDNQILGKALETQPAGYITKPFNEANVYAAIKIALANTFIKETERLVIKDGFDLIKLDPNEILFVQSEGNYIDIYSEGGKRSFRYSLEWFLTQVAERQFMRVHRSYVVNMNHIVKLTGSNLQIHDKVIPVSRKSLPELRIRLVDASS